MGKGRPGLPYRQDRTADTGARLPFKGQLQRSQVGASRVSEYLDAFQAQVLTQPLEVLDDANHPLVTLADTMDGGADKAAELANT